MWIRSDNTYQKYLALVISVLLHGILFLSYNKMDKTNSVPIKILTRQIDQRKHDKWLEFVLVETPEDARSEKPPQKADLLSDKNSIARDQYQKKDKPIGDPYSEGDLKIKIPPSAKSAPPLPPAAEPASERAYKRKKNQSDEFLASRYEFKKFSREQLLGTAPARPSTQSGFNLNRPTYNNTESSAGNYGGFSFNTYNWDFAPYMLEMKRKVERNVFPPPAFTYMGLISGETILRFKVMPNGEVKDLTVLKYTGHESLKETSVRAILNSSPFKPLPADFPENYLEVTASFTYYVKH